MLTNQEPNDLNSVNEKIEQFIKQLNGLTVQPHFLKQEKVKLTEKELDDLNSANKKWARFNEQFEGLVVQRESKEGPVVQQEAKNWYECGEYYGPALTNAEKHAMQKAREIKDRERQEKFWNSLSEEEHAARQIVSYLCTRYGIDNE